MLGWGADTVKLASPGTFADKKTSRTGKTLVYSHV